MVWRGPKIYILSVISVTGKRIVVNIAHCYRKEINVVVNCSKTETLSIGKIS